MAGSEMPRGDARVVHLVVTLRGEADGIGARRLPRYEAQHPGDGRAVGSAGQKRADRPVRGRGAHALAHAAEERLLQLRKRTPLVLDVAHFPVRLCLRAVPAPVEQGARQEPGPSRVNGSGSGDHVEVDVVVDGLPIDLRLDAGKRADRVERGTEDEPAARIGVAHGRACHPVGSEHRHCGPRVQDGERKTAREKRQHSRSLPVVSFRDRAREAMFPRDGRFRAGPAGASPDRDEKTVIQPQIGFAARGGYRKRTACERGAARAAAAVANERG